MTKDKAIAELVRIWHSPHLDLSLKAGLAEAIETLKEKNQSDSLVRGEVDACKESESKLDLISRQDAIEAVRTAKAVFDTTLEPYIKPQDAVDALSALPSAEAVQGEWIHDGQNFKGGLDWCHCSECGYKTSANGLSVYRYCPNCGAKMMTKGGDDE